MGIDDMAQNENADSKALENVHARIAFADENLRVPIKLLFGDHLGLKNYQNWRWMSRNRLPEMNFSCFFFPLWFSQSRAFSFRLSLETSEFYKGGVIVTSIKKD